MLMMILQETLSLEMVVSCRMQLVKT
uniref:Uncharacterized protein n=1 Tax=Arundo donax TaxID=35708 RepID=A0A0A9ALY2_ARUDO